MIVTGIVIRVINWLKLHERDDTPSGCVYAYAIHHFENWLGEVRNRLGVEIYVRRGIVLERYRRGILFEYYNGLLGGELKRFLGHEACRVVAESEEVITEAVEDVVRYIKTLFLLLYDQRTGFSNSEKMLASLHIFAISLPSSDYKMMMHLDKHSWEIRKIELIQPN